MPGICYKYVLLITHFISFISLFLFHFTISITYSTHSDFVLLWLSSISHLYHCHSEIYDKKGSISHSILLVLLLSLFHFIYYNFISISLCHHHQFLLLHHHQFLITLSYHQFLLLHISLLWHHHYYYFDIIFITLSSFIIIYYHDIILHSMIIIISFCIIYIIPDKIHEKEAVTLDFNQFVQLFHKKEAVTICFGHFVRLFHEKEAKTILATHNLGNGRIPNSH